MTGVKSITVTATTGAITDNTVAEGAGNENPSGGAITLIAATGISASGADADINTDVAQIDATTQSGGIYLAETDAVQLGNLAVTGADGGPIQVTAGGDLTVRTSSYHSRERRASPPGNKQRPDRAAEWLCADGRCGHPRHRHRYRSPGGDG